MIKIIGIFILIVASSTILGFFYGEKFKKRVKELKEFQRGVYVLKVKLILPIHCFQMLFIRFMKNVNNP